MIKKQKGFSLIEIIIYTSLLSLIMTVLITSIYSADVSNMKIQNNIINEY
jgi:type II secretory pathway pseudopilin PulG